MNLTCWLEVDEAREKGDLSISVCVFVCSCVCLCNQVTCYVHSGFSFVRPADELIHAQTINFVCFIC